MEIVSRINLWMIMFTSFYAYHVTYGAFSIFLLIANVFLFGKIVYDWGYSDGRYEDLHE